MSKIMYKIYAENIKNKLLNNEQSQKIIEEIVFNQYSLFYNLKEGYNVANINTDILTNKLKQYIISKKGELGLVVDNLKQYYENKNNKTKKKDKILSHIINNLTKDFLLDLSLVHFFIHYNSIYHYPLYFA